MPPSTPVTSASSTPVILACVRGRGRTKVVALADEALACLAFVEFEIHRARYSDGKGCCSQAKCSLTHVPIDNEVVECFAALHFSRRVSRCDYSAMVVAAIISSYPRRPWLPFCLPKPTTSISSHVCPRTTSKLTEDPSLHRRS